MSRQRQQPNMSDISLTPQQIAFQEGRASREGYIHRVLVGFDQFWNVVLDGKPDETISSRTRREVDDPTAKHKLLAKVLNHLLDDIQANHGAKAEAGDLERATVVESVEKESLEISSESLDSA